MLSFKIIHQDRKTAARTGEIVTSHGIIHTPALMPVGTQASVKSLSSEDLREIGVEVVMTNTYHLSLRPGEDVVKQFGGIAKFMNWNGPTMTDSGGFQVFSLGVGGDVKLLQEDQYTVDSNQYSVISNKNIENRRQITDYRLPSTEAHPRLNKITEEGVYFQSHIDGRQLLLTPENSIEIQKKLGADLIVAFDDLESPHYSYEETLKSLEQTERWELRSKAEYNSQQLLYGVTHGGQFEDLRIRSARFVDQNFAAVALGGAHSNKQNMYEVVNWTVANVDPAKPRHMLGVGEVDDIFELVERGIDTFDCVIPTRMGRVGWVFVRPPFGKSNNRFRYDITKTQFTKDKKPLDKNCSCRVCAQYTRGYINHLFRARELLGYRLATYHNVFFFTQLMKDIRESIFAENFSALMKKWT